MLVLTMHAEEEHLMPVLKAGAAGYLVKSAADRELVDAVRAVANGDVYVRPAAARVLAHGLTRKDPEKADRERFESLSERERDVLRFTAQGYTAPEVGVKLTISPKTVDTYKQRINEKLGLATSRGLRATRRASGTADRLAGASAPGPVSALRRHRIRRSLTAGRPASCDPPSWPTVADLWW